MTLGLFINILFFFFMGLAAIIKPRSVVTFVSFYPETVDARNEVRGVYGGFGIVLAGLLIASDYLPEYKPGILITVAGALFGMAGGRILSSFLERPGAWPLFFICMESALATLLIPGL